MKFHKVTKVQIPVHTQDGNKQWLSFRFTGTVDLRRIRRAIRTSMKNVYGHSYKKEHFRRYAAIINTYLTTAELVHEQQDTDVAGCWIQQFLANEKEYADQDNGDTSLQTDNTRETTL